MLIKNMFSNFSDILRVVYIYATYLLVLASLDSEMSTYIFIENWYIQDFLILYKCCLSFYASLKLQ